MLYSDEHRCGSVLKPPRRLLSSSYEDLVGRPARRYRAPGGRFCNWGSKVCSSRFELWHRDQLALKSFLKYRLQAVDGAKLSWPPPASLWASKLQDGLAIYRGHIIGISRWSRTRSWMRPSLGTGARQTPATVAALAVSSAEGDAAEA